MGLWGAMQREGNVLRQRPMRRGERGVHLLCGVVRECVLDRGWLLGRRGLWWGRAGTMCEPGVRVRKRIRGEVVRAMRSGGVRMGMRG